MLGFQKDALISRLCKFGYSLAEAAGLINLYEKNNDIESLIGYVEEKEKEVSGRKYNAGVI